MREQKRKRNKRYNPNRIQTNPTAGLALLNNAYQDNTPIPENDLTELSIAYWISFDLLASAEHASSESWNTVTAALNISQILAEQGIGNELMPLVHKAQDGMVRSYERQKIHKVWRLDGPALNDVRLALSAIDEQIKMSKKSEMRSALNEAIRRISAGNTLKTGGKNA